MVQLLVAEVAVGLVMVLWTMVQMVQLEMALLKLMSYLSIAIDSAHI